MLLAQFYVTPRVTHHVTRPRSSRTMSRFARDLVTGGAACEPAEGAGPSGQTRNPISRVADVLLGDRGKGARENQLQVGREQGASTAWSDSRIRAHVGREETDFRRASADGREHALAREANGVDLAREGLLGAPDMGYGAYAAPSMAPARALVDARFDPRAAAVEKQFARSRSAVMARHLQSQGDMGAAFESMRVDERDMSARARMARDAAVLREMQHGEHWAQGFQQPAYSQASSSSWANEFANLEAATQRNWAHEYQRYLPPRAVHAPPYMDQWAQEFQSNQGARWGEEFSTLNRNTWADEFAKQQSPQTPMMDVAAQTAKQSSELAATLNADPKFANSKFAALMSKLGSGQVVVKDDGLHEIGESMREQHAATGERWAQEFASGTEQRSTWANEFAAQAQRQAPIGDAWAEQYAQRETSFQRQSTIDDWAEEFKNVPREWASEFEDMQRSNPEWMQNVWDDMQRDALSSRSNYRFTDPNPYLGQSGLQEKTLDLAKNGVLSEAILAAEAWVRQDEGNSEAWYHLGRIQAENDDDQQSIAAMSKAHEANPQNPNVLLALAVSHANELDQDEALGHAREWLASQDRFKHIVSAQGPPTPESVMAMFKEAARQIPNDADVQTVLGVMAHLTRNYEEAVNAFQRAASLRPADYSIWNKIGATQANGAESSDAIGAYRRALDIKPNYVRAWSNMGIGYANQGRYAESLPYYVRALALNPSPESATWGYVRISLGCIGRLDLLHHCDNRDVGALSREFPL